MTRAPIIRAFLGADEIYVDLFAGGGGASLGGEKATGRSPDIAINHSPDAIAMHRANHPTTTHYIENVYEVDPRVASGGRPVALLWLSPDCTHHSKAKGGKPRQQKIRGLAWSAIPWAQHCRPRVIVLENVEEWLDWGPIDRATGQPIKTRKGQTFRAWRRKLESFGYVVEHRLLRACDYGAPTTRRRLFLIARCDGKPIRWPDPTHGPERTGRPNRHRTAAEIIDWSIACPSIFDRDRPLADKTMARIARGIRKYVLESAKPFVIAVNHGGVGRTDHRVHDLDAPMPTVTGGQRGGHALVTPYLMPNNTNNVPKGADEPVPTITTGNRNFLVTPIVVKAKTHGGGGNDAMPANEPLRTVTASKRGEFAVVSAIVVPATHDDKHGAPDQRTHPVDEPLRTITTLGAQYHVAVPYLVHRSNGERVGQAPRIYDVAAFLAKHYGQRDTGGWNGGAQLDLPIGTVTAQDHHAVVAAHLTKLYGTSTGADAREPVPTVTGEGQRIGAVAAHLVRYNGDRPGAERVTDIEHPLGTQDTANRFALVAAFLARYNGQSKEQPVTAPIGTLDTTDRYALVTVMIDGEQYAIVDIGMRMLTPRELFRAQGFPDNYVIDPVGESGKPLTKTAQIRACGNSVPPDLSEAIIRELGAA